MTDRATKPLTSEDLPALSVYVLTRFYDLTQTDDPTEVREVFEDFIAFAPDLARAVIDLTEKAERMEALAESLDASALWAINHPDVDDELKAHAHADRGLAAQIRAVLDGETA